jgi:hypothetical protein
MVVIAAAPDSTLLVSMMFGAASAGAAGTCGAAGVSGTTAGGSTTGVDAGAGDAFIGAA